jgi:alkylhydroperoxidase family enzyme
VRAPTVRCSQDGEEALLALTRRVVRTGGAGAGSKLAQARKTGVSDGELVEALVHIASKQFTDAVAIVAQTDIDHPKQPCLPSM